MGHERYGRGGGAFCKQAAIKLYGRKKNGIHLTLQHPVKTVSYHNNLYFININYFSRGSFVQGRAMYVLTHCDKHLKAFLHLCASSTNEAFKCVVVE